MGGSPAPYSSSLGREMSALKCFNLFAASKVQGFCQQGAGEGLAGCTAHLKVNHWHHLTAPCYKAALLIYLISKLFIRPKPPEVHCRCGPAAQCHQAPHCAPLRSTSPCRCTAACMDIAWNHKAISSHKALTVVQHCMSFTDQERWGMPAAEQLCKKIKYLDLGWH